MKPVGKWAAAVGLTLRLDGPIVRRLIGWRRLFGRWHMPRTEGSVNFWALPVLAMAFMVRSRNPGQPVTASIAP